MAEDESNKREESGMIDCLLACAMAMTLTPQVALPAPPVPQAAAAPVDPAALAAARKLIAQMNIEATFDRMFIQLSPVFAQGVIGAMSQDADGKALIAAIDAKPDGRERLIQILTQEFMVAIKRQYPALIDSTTKEYAAAFTEQELDAISAFYASGPGAKALRLLPELQQKISVAGRLLGQTAGAQAGQRALERAESEILHIDDQPKS